MVKTEGQISVRTVTTERKIKIWETCNCTWTIGNFKALNDKVGLQVVSPEFRAKVTSKCEWQLFLYPFGQNEDTKDFVGLYIRLLSGPKCPIFGKCSFTLQNLKNHVIEKATFEREFSDGYRYGYDKLIDRNQVKSSIYNDVLDIVVEISCIVDELENCHEIKSAACTPDVVLAKAFHSMLKNEEFCDAVLLTGDGEVKAHRNVLSARSTVFAAMFAHNVLESVTGKIEIHDFSLKIVRAMLNFMYSGKIEITDSNMSIDLMRAADKYDLQDLKVLCADYLSMNINGNNAGDILFVADLTESQKLKENATQFIVRNSFRFTEVDQFRKLEIENPRLLNELLLLKMEETSSFKNPASYSFKKLLYESWEGRDVNSEAPEKSNRSEEPALATSMAATDDWYVTEEWSAEPAPATNFTATDDWSVAEEWGAGPASATRVDTKGPENNWDTTYSDDGW